jgi:hypothetical protein
VSLNPVCTISRVVAWVTSRLFIEMAHLLRRLVSCSRNPTVSPWETTQIDKIIQSHEEQLDIRAGHDTDSWVRPIAQCHCDGTVATAHRASVGGAVIRILQRFQLLSRLIRLPPVTFIAAPSVLRPNRQNYCLLCVVHHMRCRQVLS